MITTACGAAGVIADVRSEEHCLNARPGELTSGWITAAGPVLACAYAYAYAYAGLAPASRR